MSESYKLAIIAAMEVEVKKFVRGWNKFVIVGNGRPDVPVWHRDGVAVAVVGAGWERATSGTKMAIHTLRPGLVTSVGFTGSLTSDLPVGALFVPAQVIESKSGKTIESAGGSGRLVTVPEVAAASAKSALVSQFGAQAVDMEAAAVAEVAAQHGVRFAAVKAVSDGPEDRMEIFAPFMTPDGFRTAAFVAHIAVRPSLWKHVKQMAVNSAMAGETLTKAMQELAANPERFFEQHSRTGMSAPNGK